MNKDVFILGGARTPMTEYVGALKDISALELGAIASRAALQKTGVKPEWIDHAVVGNVLQTSSDAIYGARHVALKAGVPIEVPALTVNRLCGSGIQAAVSGAQLIQLEEADIVLTGGIESMSQAPHVIRGLRSGLRLNQGKLEDYLYEALLDPYCGLFMAQTAEKCASKYGVSREEQDAFACRSQQLAAKAWAEGRFADEVTPVEIKTRKGVTVVDQDDHLRPDTTMEGLAKLPAAFSKEGTVTAGNASGIVDGGAALILASGKAVKEKGLTPAARLVSWAAVGVDPAYMGMGPAPSTRKALERAGLKLDQIDLIEVNEAFAGQYLAVEKELGLDREKVNVNGGAIALGHPLGASGTRLLLTITLELKRRGAKYGLATACIGGGQGIAAIVENLQTEGATSVAPEHMTIKTVGVLGCGLMGSGIAQISAASGFKTFVLEVNEGVLQKGLARVDKFLSDGVAKGKLAADDRDKTLGNLKGTTSYADLKDCDLVIEAIVENVDVKKQAYAQVEANVGPHCLIASNTSSLCITELAAATKRPDKVGGLHFFNPVPLMKLVEVIRALTTSNETYQELFAFAKAVGKEPITAPDKGGFIVNRLLVPYLLDAIRCLEEGLGTVEDIDKGMKLGCGHPMGPLTLLDFVGLDTTYYIANIMFDEFREQRFAPPPLLKRMVLAGHHGKKSGKGFYDYTK